MIPIGKPVAAPLRPVPLAYHNKSYKKVDETEHDGILEKIDTSSWVSNMILIPKPDEDIRLWLDSRKINKAIIPDGFRLVPIEKLSKLFADPTEFYSLDLKARYWQIEFDQELRSLTAMLISTGG